MLAMRYILIWTVWRKQGTFLRGELPMTMGETLRKFNMRRCADIKPAIYGKRSKIFGAKESPHRIMRNLFKKAGFIPMLCLYGRPYVNVVRKMNRMVYKSNAEIAIIPLMDVLSLDDSARLNTPGTVGSPNWEWRLTDWKCLQRQKPIIAQLVVESKRDKW